jgi:CDP-diacylglycerol--glycerol-3-phosphate 3-phosphatidyltransferase
MSLLDRIAEPVRRRALVPLAWFLSRRGVSADAVTVVGTMGVVVTSATVVACGYLLAGSLLVGFFAVADLLDGTMARVTGRSTPWGAFLDSTLDRVADAALLAGLAFWFHTRGDGVGLALAVACLAAAPVVPYARARAQGLGVDTPDGVAARADRLVAVLLGMLAVGLGAPVVVLQGVLALLLLAIGATVVQRMAVARRGLLAARPVAGEPVRR